MHTEVSPVRRVLLDELATEIVDARAIRVGIDGVDGSGKTIFADQLAAVLRAAGREVVRVSIDGFHNPREVRYRRGRSSPEGFWLDSYDYATFRASVIKPFASDGDRHYLAAVRDVATDKFIDNPTKIAPKDAPLVVDGFFLHRDELADSWDHSIFLRVGFDETFARMASRDGCPSDPTAPENHRYLAGSRSTSRPATRNRAPT